MLKLRASLPFLAAALALLIVAGCSRKAEDHYQSGMAFLQKKDFKNARIEFSNAVRQRPDYAEAFYQLGVAAMELKDNTAAKRYLQTSEHWSQGQGPFEADIRLRLGLLALQGRDFKTSREQAGWLLERDPSNQKARELLVISLTGLAEPESAAHELDRWLAADPNSEEAREIRAGILLRDNEVEAACRQLEEAAALPNPSADVLVALGNLYQVLKRPEKAEETYRRTLKKYPGNIPARNELSWLYARLGQRQKAEEGFREMARLYPRDAGARGALAGYYLELRDWPLAIAELERLSVDPHDGFNRDRLAAVYLLVGRSADAARLVQQSLKENPADTQARLLSGILKLQAGQARESIAELSRVVYERPESATARFYLGAAQSRQGDEQLAEGSMRAALGLDPSLLNARLWLAEHYLKTGAANNALSILDGAPGQQRNAAPARLLRTLSYLRGKDSKSALGEIRALRAENPNLVPRYYETVFMHLFDGRSEMARKALEEELKNQPASVELLAMLAQTWIAEGRPALAVARLEKQMAQITPSAAHYELLGDIQRTAGNYDAARAAYGREAQLNPGTRDSIIRLAQTEMAAGNLNGARLQCEALTNRWPSSGIGWTLLAAVREKEGAYPEAIKAYEKAVALDPANAIAANNLAWRLLTDKGESGRALKLAEQARHVEPRNPSFADTLGWIYYRMGSSAFALAQLEEAVRREPNNALFLYHLGVVQSKEKREKEAIASLEAALKANPNFPDAGAARQVLEKLKTPR